MKELSLPALEGTNPLGFLAALGVLDELNGLQYDVTLRWTDELVPHAILGGLGDPAELIAALDHQRRAWSTSRVLRFPEAAPLSDAKPDDKVLRRWFETALDACSGPDIDLLCAIVAEGALDGNGNAKPTHLHFTAGQQRFLDMARTLAAGVEEARLREAVFGPWRYDSSLPSLWWDVARGDRVYALRATNPSNDKRLGVPGADWLAFRGLAFYPVRAVGGSLRTTACNAEWKRSAFRWPLWAARATRDTARSLVADQSLVSRRARPSGSALAVRGLLCVLEAPIRRTEQGGYGSFGGPESIAIADEN